MPQGEGRFPPGEGRIASAYRAGRFPRSPMLVGGGALLALSCALVLLGEQVSGFFLSVFSVGMNEFARRPGCAEATHSMLMSLGVVLLPFLVLVLAAGALLAMLFALAARRHKGTTAVPLPRPKNGYAARAVLRGFGGVLFVLVSFLIIKETPIHGLDPRELLSTLGKTTLRLAAAAGCIMALIGVLEISLERHLVWRSLFLDTSEAMREKRAGEGDPMIRRESRRRHREKEYT